MADFDEPDWEEVERIAQACVDEDDGIPFELVEPEIRAFAQTA